MNKEDIAGYIILTRTGDEWQPDWDGLLHPSLEDAETEAWDPIQRGIPCCIVKCVVVSDND